MTTPSLQDLSVLVSWPAGSIGEQNELRAIATLHALCEEHGYGRIPQLAAAIEQIWRDPSKVAKFREEIGRWKESVAEARRQTGLTP